MPNVLNQWLRAVILALGIFIFWECMKPVTELTILQSQTYLFLFLVSLVLLFYFQLPLWLIGLSGVILTGYGIHFYFYRNEPYLSAQWILSAARAIGDNALLVWSGDLADLSDLFSAFLFFVLLWLVCFVVAHWLKTGRLYMFFFLAVTSLSMIDTFTYYKTQQSIVYVAAAGLLILSVQRYIVMRSRTSETRGRQSIGKWIIALAIAGLLLVFLGFAGPKPGPQWPSPILYLQNKGWLGVNTAGSFFSAGQRIGYDADDTHLGGSLGMDSTVVFTAHVSGGSNYWRVASKDVYTGKGWESSGGSYFPLMQPSGERAFSLYGSSTKVTKETATVSFSAASPPILPYIGQLAAINVPGKQLKMNPLAGQVLTRDESRAKSEQIGYLEPIYQLQALRNTTPGTDPPLVREQDLQLPKELPNRVRTLAFRITAGENNRYDKVMAVLRYLKSSRFTYSTTQVSRPARNQDYVDQFLFDTRVGYCDNFSTSMVALLRSAGIPARWVKGFSGGTYSGEAMDTVGGKKVSRSVYEIRNADAHSWVEAYFPGSGWVSFEPTPTFADPGRFTNAAQGNGKASSAGRTNTAERSTAATGQQTRPQRQQAQTKQTQNSAGMNRQQAQTKAAVTHTAGKQSTAKSSNNKWKTFGLIVVLVIAGTAVLAFMTRKKWLSWIYVRELSRVSVRDVHSFNSAYTDLNRLLGFMGIRRENTQTLREFSERVDRRLSGNNMMQLTGHYERLVYADKIRISDEEQVEIGMLFREIADQLTDKKKN